MPHSRQFLVEVANEQDHLPIPSRTLAQAVREVLRGEGIASATISVAVVDDKAIWELNRRYLRHDYPTDVLSFVLEQDDEHLDGEIIASAEHAVAAAQEYKWPAASELLLYIVHGMLHLAGFDDHTPQDRTAMREREDHYLTRLGIGTPPHAVRRGAVPRRKSRRS